MLKVRKKVTKQFDQAGPPYGLGAQVQVKQEEETFEGLLVRMKCPVNLVCMDLLFLFVVLEASSF